MGDPEHATPAPEPAALVDGGATDQQGPPDLVKKITHEVDTDDMFVQSGE